MTGESNDITQWTFAMVDLAGFTAFPEAHEDAEAADLAIGSPSWPSADSAQTTSSAPRST